MQLRTENMFYYIFIDYTLFLFSFYCFRLNFLTFMVLFSFQNTASFILVSSLRLQCPISV